jgi:Holliday junction resolvase RusA-like endonuclease
MLKIFSPPTGQPRPRYSAKTKRFYNPRSAESFKSEIVHQMRNAVGNLQLNPPIKIKMVFAVKNPIARPDGDNIEKAVLDALRPWFDDAKVVECSWVKNPAEFSKITIETA